MKIENGILVVIGSITIAGVCMIMHRLDVMDDKLENGFHYRRYCVTTELLK